MLVLKAMKPSSIQCIRAQGIYTDDEASSGLVWSCETKLDEFPRQHLPNMIVKGINCYTQSIPLTSI